MFCSENDLVNCWLCNMFVFKVYTSEQLLVNFISGLTENWAHLHRQNCKHVKSVYILNNEGHFVLSDYTTEKKRKVHVQYNGFLCQMWFDTFVTCLKAIEICKIVTYIQNRLNTWSDCAQKFKEILACCSWQSHWYICMLHLRTIIPIQMLLYTLGILNLFE